jgi:hypothetical protein
VIRGALPVAAVRDLLGITRALYRAERDGAGDPVRLQSKPSANGVLSAIESRGSTRSP